MTKFLGAIDKSGTDGNNNLLELANNYMFNSGDVVYTFNTEDRYMGYISNLCNIMIASSIAIGKNDT